MWTDVYKYVDYEDIPSTPDHFTYEKSCVNDKPCYNSTKLVNTICFPISRYAKYNVYLRFRKPVTVQEAVKGAEKYLSQPITKEYYEEIQDNCFQGTFTWEAVRGMYKTRGAALSDLHFLENIKVQDGILRVSLGS